MGIRLVVADDHPIARAGLMSLVRGTDISVVGAAATGEEALALVTKHDPDVVLVDVRMPGKDGLWTLRRLKRDRPTMPVLMWSAFDNPAFIAQAVASGAKGYVLKSAARDELVQAICLAAAGGATWTRTQLKRLPRQPASGRPATTEEAPLTRRERDVLKQLVEGATNKEAARALGIGAETVKEHVQRILRKIGTTDRTQTALWAVRNKVD